MFKYHLETWQLIHRLEILSPPTHSIIDFLDL